jgi:outer membrane protein OmpA-like peptidoglycan-associated protein
MNRASLAIVLAASMAASVGCASKKYVKEQTTPIINKTNELDDLTAQNTKAIKDVDARAQAGIQDVNNKTAAADQKAQAAGQQATQAQQLADNAVHRVGVLSDAVANLDNYKVVGETSVHFGFDRDFLTTQAKDELDKLASNVPNTKGTSSPSKAAPIQQVRPTTTMD